MSLRQKYLKILSGMRSSGAAGVSLLLGSAAPVAADRRSGRARSPGPPGRTRVSERLAAIRDAVSDVAAPRRRR